MTTTTKRYILEEKSNGLYRVWTRDGEQVVADNIRESQVKYYQ